MTRLVNTCDRYCALLQNLSADDFNVVAVQEIVSFITFFSDSFTRRVTHIIILYALKTKIRNRIQPPRGTVTGAL